MKRALLLLAFTASGLLLWLGLRSGSAIPLSTAALDAFPAVQQKLPEAQRQSDEIALPKISSNGRSVDLLADPVSLPPTLGPASAASAASRDNVLDLVPLNEVAKANALSAAPPAMITEVTPLSSEVRAIASPQPPLRPTPAIRWPLALQELDLQVAGLSAEQVGTLDEIADNFIANVGGEDQTASDPSYRKRWQAQQPTADQLFRTLYGTKAFLQAQLATTHEATQPPPATEP